METHDHSQSKSYTVSGESMTVEHPRSLEGLLTDVRNRGTDEVAAAMAFELVTRRPGLVRVNYHGLVLLMKVLFETWGDDGLVSSGAMIAPVHFVQVRKKLSFMR